MAVDSEMWRNLRDLLGQRGLYLPKRQNVLIANAVHKDVQEELPWPDYDQSRSADNSKVDPCQGQRRNLGEATNMMEAGTTAATFHAEINKEKSLVRHRSILLPHALYDVITWKTCLRHTAVRTISILGRQPKTFSESTCSFLEDVTNRTLLKKIGTVPSLSCWPETSPELSW